MKNNTKTITIEIEFESQLDFRAEMDKIVIDMKRGIPARKYHSSSFEVRNKNTDKNMIENFRFEEINGKNCLIIPSKLNTMKHYD